MRFDSSRFSEINDDIQMYMICLIRNATEHSTSHLIPNHLK